MADVAKIIMEKLESAAKDFVKEEAKAFLAEGLAFGESIAGDLGKWTAAYQAGNIDEAGLKRLLKRRQTALEMQAIKRAGISEIRVEQLQNQMLSIVTSAISTAI